MDDLTRLEDKVKLANLQIDKRLATLEASMEELEKSMRNTTEEIVKIKNSMARSATPSMTGDDLSDLAEQFRQLRAAFTDLRTRLEREGSIPDIDELSKRVDALEKQLSAVPIILD